MRLVKVLEALQLRPMWDEQLTPGAEFSPELLKFIVNCHIFLPFLTRSSVNSSWLNQEIGFAVAVAKPILPVTLGESPSGIISGREAIELRKDLADAAEKITIEQIRRVVNGSKDRGATYESTDDNTQRAALLADYAESVSALDRFGQVRQRASLTTFHLPTHDPAHAIWNRYFVSASNQTTLYRALHAERVALEMHAEREGCRLIIDPVKTVERVYRRHGPASVRARISGLLNFLRGRAVNDVVIAINNDPARYRSVTLVGDWFYSEAVTSAISGNELRGLKESLFTRHQQTVRREIDYFDQHLDDLLADRGWTRQSSRSEAIAYLETYLERSAVT